jgi:hypothetical protein
VIEKESERQQEATTVMGVDDEVRRKKRSSKKGRADDMGRPEGVEYHTDQSVLASQGWRSIFGGSSVQAG